MRRGGELGDEGLEGFQIRRHAFENEVDLPRQHPAFAHQRLCAHEILEGFEVGIGLAGEVDHGEDGHFVAETLLVEQRDTVSGPPSLSRENPMTTPRRILVVDDNPDSAMSLEKLLTLTGHEARIAGDGLTAVSEAERFRPEVVLLDIGLPRLNGYDACRVIREQPWGANMILVAVTGWGQEEDRRRSREAGFDGHLVKPVDLDELMKLLDDVALDRKS